uniref:AlNc14C23G2324 protein n=1 Tax=Albugo laibachii Nc14 TaxID=890382 RepID=F0W619_9STRA|nr:AlNc14C23G2324 [Albugo laibachii Nc14]|eukprot:CCA16561.1 AlNc14C23G2324 [Albugo laibachii Nc14]
MIRILKKQCQVKNVAFECSVTKAHLTIILIVNQIPSIEQSVHELYSVQQVNYVKSFCSTNRIIYSFIHRNASACIRSPFPIASDT